MGSNTLETNEMQMRTVLTRTKGEKGERDYANSSSRSKNNNQCTMYERKGEKWDGGYSYYKKDSGNPDSSSRSSSGTMGTFSTALLSILLRHFSIVVSKGTNLFDL